MEIPTIFYSEGTCALGSIITAEWSKLPYQLCRLEEGYDENPNFLKINPLGAVPVLKVGREFITQSFAVLQHLAHQHPHHHVNPENLTFSPGHVDFDRLNQVLSFLVTDFHKAFGPLYDPETTKAQKDEIVGGSLRQLYNYVDHYLVPRGLIFGNRSIADAYLYGVVRWGNTLYDIPSEFPNIANFQSIMDGDPAVQFAIAIEKQKPAKTSGMFLDHIELKAISDLVEPNFPGLPLAGVPSAGNLAAQIEMDQARADGASIL